MGRWHRLAFAAKCRGAKKKDDQESTQERRHEVNGYDYPNRTWERARNMKTADQGNCEGFHYQTRGHEDG